MYIIIKEVQNHQVKLLEDKMAQLENFIPTWEPQHRICLSIYVLFLLRKNFLPSQTNEVRHDQKVKT